jgi:uncharacterized protein (DUF2225 family)
MKEYEVEIIKCPVCGKTGILKIIERDSNDIPHFIEDVGPFKTAIFKCEDCGFTVLSNTESLEDSDLKIIKKVKKELKDFINIRDDFRLEQAYKSIGALILRKMGTRNLNLKDVIKFINDSTWKT